jgi:hypothetical protein
VPPFYRTKSLPEVPPLGSGLFANTLGKTGCAPSHGQEIILAGSESPKLWLRESFVARLRSGARPARKSTMKAIHIQLPDRLTKRILFPSASPPRAAGHPRLLIESGRCGNWYAFFRSLRAVLSGVLDSSAYDQVSLGREVSVAFTSQGPVVYRCGRNRRVHPIPATRETNRSCQLARK